PSRINAAPPKAVNTGAPSTTATNRTTNAGQRSFSGSTGSHIATATIATARASVAARQRHFSAPCQTSRTATSANPITITSCTSQTGTPYASIFPSDCCATTNCQQATPSQALTAAAKPWLKTRANVSQPPLNQWVAADSAS